MNKEWTYQYQEGACTRVVCKFEKHRQHALPNIEQGLDNQTRNGIEQLHTLFVELGTWHRLGEEEGKMSTFRSELERKWKLVLPIIPVITQPIRSDNLKR
jgi:hypothetical protein